MKQSREAMSEIKHNFSCRVIFHTEQHIIYSQPITLSFRREIRRVARMQSPLARCPIEVFAEVF